MSDSVQPHRWQPTRLPRPWDSPGKNTGVGCHFLLQCMKVKSESEVAQSCPTLATPWTAAYEAPPSMGFSRQKYWSVVPLPSPNFPLSIYFTYFNVTLSICPILSFSLCVHKYVLYASLFLPCKQVHQYHFLDSIYIYTLIYNIFFLFLAYFTLYNRL